MRIRHVPIVGWIVLVTLLSMAPRASAQVVLDVGGGFEVPFERDQRDDYGTSSSMTAAVAAELGNHRTLAFLEVGRTHGSGEQFPSDPTFDLKESEFRLVPISIGVRTNFVKPSAEGRVALYGGVAWQTVLARFENPVGRSESIPTIGLALELRPEIRIGPRWGVWVRQRITLLGDADFGDLAGQLDMSGSSVNAGISWRTM